MKKVLLALGIVFSGFWATSNIVYGTDPWSVVSQYIHVNEVNDRVGIHTEFPQTDLHVIGNTMIQGDTAARGKLISDINDDNADGNFDIWIQGGERWMTGDDRNLAILGYDEDSGDSLRINFNNEYENGTQIDGNLGIGTAATTQALTVSGSISANEYCDVNGQNCVSSSGVNSSASDITHVTQTQTTTVADRTWTIIDFDTETRDDSNWHDPSINTSRITVDEDGLYEINAFVTRNTTANARVAIRVLVNGVIAYERWNIQGSVYVKQSQSIDVKHFLMNGDYVEIEFWSEGSGTNQTVGDATYLYVEKL